MGIALRVRRFVKNGTENAMLAPASLAIMPIFGADQAE
jgi:hypothetical protein